MARSKQDTRDLNVLSNADYGRLSKRAYLGKAISKAAFKVNRKLNE